MSASAPPEEPQDSRPIPQSDLDISKKPPSARRRRLKEVLRNDVSAGLVNAVVSVPDGLASAALAGVNPVYGLYTSITAPIAGGVLVSTQLMQISTTSASALAAGQAIANYPEQQRDTALFLLTLMTGLSLAVFALLRLGRLVRYVSHAVMTGFLLGIAIVLVLDQLAPLLGLSPRGANELTQAWDLIQQLPQLDLRTASIGAMALAILLVIARTRWRNYASLIALVVPTAAIFVLGWQGVATVSDVSPIPRALPKLQMPDFSLITPQLIFAALSLAVVIAVQGAGVGQSIENPDGRRSDATRDLLAQGAANAAAGLFSGIPAGGSVGQTALNISVGARTRWASILGGIWMLIIVLLLPTVIGWVPMTVLAAVMVVAGWQAIDAPEARAIWRTSTSARAILIATVVATLILSIPLAVLLGVTLALWVAIASAARDVQLRRLTPGARGAWLEGDPPKRLDEDAVVVLDVVGSVFSLERVLCKMRCQHQARRNGQ